MRTAKELVKIFSEMNPEDKVWITWIDKDEVIERVQEHIDNLDEDEAIGITAEAIATDDFLQSVFDGIDNDDYLWERFSENYVDTVSNLVSKSLNEIKEDEHLWDKETEKANGTREKDN